MTRKHFIRLAHIVAEIEDEATFHRVADQIARMCREDNPSFHAGLFYAEADAMRKELHADIHRG